MNLFSKDKEFVLKLINGILLIWVIIATVIVFNNVVNLLVRDPKLTYDEYKLVNCASDITEGVSEAEVDCQNQYQVIDINNRTQNYYYYRSILVCLANILLVGGVLILLNKNEPVEPKKTNKKTKK